MHSLMPWFPQCLHSEWFIYDVLALWRLADYVNSALITHANLLVSVTVFLNKRYILCICGGYLEIGMLKSAHSWHFIPISTQVMEAENKHTQYMAMSWVDILGKIK